MKNVHLFRLAFVAFAVLAVDAGILKPAREEPEREPIRVPIASASTKKEWMNEAVAEFNARSRSRGEYQVNGRPIAISIIEEEIEPGVFDHYRSGTMATDIFAGKITPVAASPGEATWLRKLNSDWKVARGGPIYTDPPSPLLQTPVVIAAWQSRAEALGCWPKPLPSCTWQRLAELSTDPRGWAALGRPEWGKLKFGYGYVGESNSGTFAVLMLCLTGLGKTSELRLEDIDANNGCGQMVGQVEKAKVHSGIKSGWLLNWMKEKGPSYLDAVVTNEQDVIEFNRQNARSLAEPLVAVYPQDGTVVRDDPYVVLDKAPWVTPEQVQAARLFQGFLLSSEQQQKLGKWGLRPRQGFESALLVELSDGANLQSAFKRVQVPDAAVFDRLGEVWHEVKKHSVIALVVDRSGRMDREKLEGTKDGILAFLETLDPQDYVIWIPFADTAKPGLQGTMREIGPQLRAQVQSEKDTGGGAALLEAINVAYSRLEELRGTLKETVRYGIVVESAGPDSRSTISFTQLRTRLEAQAGDPTSVQIHAIGIGKDAPKDRLAIIANHGRYWAAADAKLLESISREIAKYY